MEVSAFIRTTSTTWKPLPCIKQSAHPEHIMRTFQNKVVWLTGASSGIGEELAYALSKRQCRLILSARNREALERVKRYASGNREDLFVLPLDLTRPEELAAHADLAWNHFGKIDC